VRHHATLAGEVAGLGADAYTVNPLLGGDALEPFVTPRGAGVFVLVRTSNPGAADFQDLELAAGEPVWERSRARRRAGRPGARVRLQRRRRGDRGDGAAPPAARPRADAPRDLPAARASARRAAASRISPPPSRPGRAGGLPRASRSIADAHREQRRRSRRAARAEAERLRDMGVGVARYRISGSRQMIITVTLNAAIDKSLSVPSFRLGQRHRTVERRALAGGKGVNVARMLKTLGQPVIATGFQGGPTGTQIVAQLGEESILHDFVRIREESRTNTSVLDPTTGEQTEINEQGPRGRARRGRAVPREAAVPGARRGDRRVRRLAAARPGARLLRAAGARAAQARRDDRGRHRRRRAAPAVRAEPDVVSPNVIEAEELVGHEFNDDDDRLPARCARSSRSARARRS
jgi:orotidine-5'-phosphate decarboxylase